MKSIEEEFLTEVVGDKTKPTRKKSINSKQKGSRNERECKDILNKRFEGVAVFSRTPMSGAYVGGENRAAKSFLTEAQKEMMTSDIFCNNPKFKFSIEHKAYSEGSFWDLFNESSNLFKWYEQSETDAKSINKEPLLIVKYNNHKRIAFVNMSYMMKYPYLNKEKIVFIHKYKACLWLDDLLEAPDCFFFEG